MNWKRRAAKWEKKEEDERWRADNCDVQGKIICSDLLNFKRLKVKSLKEQYEWDIALVHRRCHTQCHPFITLRIISICKNLFLCAHYTLQRYLARNILTCKNFYCVSDNAHSPFFSLSLSYSHIYNKNRVGCNARFFSMK